MSSTDHKHSASSSSNSDSASRKKQNNRRIKRNKRKRKNNQHAKEKEEKKEREVKKDIHAPALAVNDPDLVVGTVNKDFICSICYSIFAMPTGSWNRVPFTVFSQHNVSLLFFLVSVCLGFECGHVFCQVCCNKLTKEVCPLDNQPITAKHPAPYLAMKISSIKFRCPNFKRGCKVEMLAGKEFQTVSNHIKVCFSLSI
jgi:hypothetical protein